MRLGTHKKYNYTPAHSVVSLEHHDFIANQPLPVRETDDAVLRHLYMHSSPCIVPASIFCNYGGRPLMIILFLPAKLVFFFGLRVCTWS